MELIEFNIRRYGSDPIMGVLLGEGVQWVVTKDNTVDYVLDGIRFSNKKYIINQHVIHNEIKSAIFPLKYTEWEKDMDTVSHLNLDDMQSFFLGLQHRTLIEVGLHDNSIIYVGNVSNVLKKSFILSTIDVNANDSGPMLVNYDKVRYIKIDSDYLNALALYTNYKTHTGTIPK